MIRTLFSTIALVLLTLKSIGQTQEAQILHVADPNIQIFATIDYEARSIYYSKRFIFEVNNQSISIGANGGVTHKSLDFRLVSNDDGATLDFVEMDFNERDIFVHSMEKMDDVMYAFYSEYDKIKNQETFNALVITIEENKIKTQDKKNLIIVDGKLNSDAYKNAGGINVTNEGKFETKINENFKKFVVHYSPKRPTQTNNKRRDDIGFSVFDENLNKTHESLKKLEESFLIVVDFTVDANDNVLAIIKDVALSKGPKVDKFELATITPSGEYKAEEIKIEKVIEDIKLAYNNIDKLYLVGYYKLEKNKSVKGVFSMSYIDQQFSDIAYNDFSFNLIVQYKELRASKKSKLEAKFKKNDFDLPLLSIRKLISMEDGSMLIVGTQEAVTWAASAPGYQSGVNTMATSPGGAITPGMSSSPGGSTRVTYKHAILTKFSSSEDKVLWNSKVPRSSTDNSISMGHSKKYFYMIFPDHPANDNIDDNTSPGTSDTFFNYDLAAYQIDLDNGQKTRYPLIKKSVILGTTIQSAKQIQVLSNDKLLLELNYKKDKFGYSKVNF